MTFRHRPNLDTPLGLLIALLIAGQIDQAEYRRRMADLERRAADSLDVEPAPVREVPHHGGSCQHWILWVLLGVAWLVGAIVIGYLVIQGLIALGELTAPRGAQTTVLEPSRDLSVTIEVSSAGLPGAPLSSSLTRHAGSGTEATGGAPQTLDPRVGREGDIAYADTRRTYVAIPLGPGIRIRVCGPASCEEMVSTDAGPDHDMLVAGRIMDLDLNRWERICGMPARFGLCPGSWVRFGAAPRLTTPPTDVAP